MSSTSAKSEEKKSLGSDPWESVTWEGNARLQRERDRTGTLREKIILLEGMAAVAQRLAEARKRSDGGQAQP